MSKSLFTSLFLAAVLLTISCKTEEDPSTDNPDVTFELIDITPESFYPKPAPDSMFEQMYSYEFPQVNSAFDIDMYWYGAAETHGIYMHFNDFAGDVLMDDNGFIQSFDSGIKLDSTLTGTWSGMTDGRFSLDYVSFPSADKGNLAGLGDKYIAFRAFSALEPHLKYYGWLRVTVAENGRSIKIIAIGFQKNANTSLKSGEI